MFDPAVDDDFFTPPPQQGRGPRPLLRFYTEAMELPGESANEGRAKYIDVDFVGITNPGSRDEVVVQAAKKAKVDDYIAWAYKKWKATQEQVVDGTPLETVPFLSKAQVMELKFVNIHTLETLADAPETAMQRVMGLRDLRKKAEAYMKAAKDTALVTKMQTELNQRDKDIALLKEQLIRVNERFEEMAKDK